MSESMLRFRCPVCQAHLVTLVDYMEQLVDCPTCSSRLVIPDRPTSSATDDQQGGAIPFAEEAIVETGPRTAQVETEMDMTPMVDMTFLLLIFFMVTARFAMQKSFELPTPDSQQPSANIRPLEEDLRVVVRVDEFNTYHVSSSFLNEEFEAPTEQELLRRMREGRSAADGSGQVANLLVVEADGDAMHAAVTTVLDAGNEMGFADIKLRSVESDDEGGS